MLRLAGSRSYSNFGREERELRIELGAALNHDPDLIVTLSSATMAITASLDCLAISEIEVPSFTFSGTALGALRSRAKTGVADIRPESISARLSVPAGKFKHKTVVAILGCKPRIDKVDRVTNPVEFSILDDAAGLANAINAKKVQSLANVHIFSLPATKPFGGGEGGIALVDDPSLARDIRRWTNFGFGETRSSERAGFNGKLSEFDAMAAKLRLKSRHRTLWHLAALRGHAKRVESRLGIYGLQQLDDYSPYWTIDFGTRREADLVRNALSREGIESRRWWGEGLHKMNAFRNELVSKSFNQTDKAAGSLLSLPFFSGMTRNHFSQIERCLESFIKRESEPLFFRE
jgi:dTDP-4-amino-4,6-dideoxygalactose transaminase